MYNTTTIPTQYDMSATNTTIFHALLSGFLLVMPFFAGIMHVVRRYDKENSMEEEDEDEEKEEEEDKITEKDKYMTEITALADRELNENDYKELKTKMVKETIEIGLGPFDEKKNVDIIMNYHKESDTFWYYTNDLKEISYKTLESVARKFVIEHNCKRLYAQQKEAEETVQSLDKEGGVACGAGGACPQEGGAGACPQEGGAGACPRSVFAKFKKYNTGTKGGLPNFSNQIKPNEQTNHFRYKGKLYHYEETLKEQKKENLPTTVLDYAAYKLLIEKEKLKA